MRVKVRAAPFEAEKIGLEVLIPEFGQCVLETAGLASPGVPLESLE